MKKPNQIVFKVNDFKISRITDGIGFYVLNFSCDASQIDRQIVEVLSHFCKDFRSSLLCQWAGVGYIFK